MNSAVHNIYKESIYTNKSWITAIGCDSAQTTTNHKPQGRNFDLKIKKWGVPIQKENEAPLGPEGKGEDNWEDVSLLIRLWGLGERRELS